MKKQRFLSMILAATFVATTLSGCTSSNAGTTSSSSISADASASGSSATTVDNAPFKMSILAQCYTPEPPKKDEEVLRRLQEYTNTELDITWMIGDDMEEKISTTLVSGNDIPMVIFIENHRVYNVTSAANVGMFWDLEPYISEFPELVEVCDPLRMSNAKIGGKTYGLPRKRLLTPYGIVYRKDWLDNLKMQPPTTVDEYFEMLRAFTEDDPDGNNKKDTYGFSTLEQMKQYQNFTVLFGAPNRWKYENDKMVPDFMTSEFIDGINFMKKIYDAGYMNKDFPVVTYSQMYENINSGKAGSYLSFSSDAASKHADLYKLNPNAKIDILDCLEGPAGKKTIADPGFSGQFFFVKNSIKDEETLKKCLNFFDKLNEEEMQNLLRWGLQDKHYVMQNGVPVRTKELNEAYTREVNVFRSLKTHYDDKAMAGVSDYAYDRSRSLANTNEAFAVTNPAYALTSATYNERGADLDTMINDAVIKYVMGELDLNGFNAVTQQWLKNGGQQIIDEYTEDHKKANS